MAEKSGELENVGRLDPVSTAAGAGRERYADDNTDAGSFERGADTDEVPPEAEQIKAQIEETRSQMGETIDAIQERLSFANISEQVSETVNNAIESAKDTAYDATIGKAVNLMKNFGDGISHSNTFRTIKNNPVPLALIGLGTGLLVYQTMSKNSSRRGNGQARGRGFYEGEGRGDGAQNRLATASTTGAIGDAAGRAYEGLSSKASSALDTVSGAAGTAYDSVTGVVSNAYSGAGELANRAYDRAGEIGTLAHDKYDEYLEENPLALGAFAVAVGAAVGFAIPSTRYEGRLMGDARENLMQRAQDAAGSLVDKAKQVAGEATQTIKEGAQDALANT